MNHDIEMVQLQRRARTAYELGRLKASTRWALLLASAGALLGGHLIGIDAAAWAPLTFVIWLCVGWKGEELLIGARYGLAAGALTFLMPMWMLRPCCRWNASGMSNCTMPEMCVAIGALVAFPLSAWAFSRHESRRLELGLGMWLGAISIAMLRCPALFIGEGLGLLGGVALGMMAASTLGTFGARARS